MRMLHGQFMGRADRVSRENLCRALKNRLDQCELAPVFSGKMS